MSEGKTILFRWLYGFHQTILRLVVLYERLLASRWGRGFYYTLLLFVVLWDGLMVMLSADEILTLSIYPGEWAKYPQGYEEMWWVYQSLNHYIFSCGYLSVASLLILGCVLYFRNSFVIAIGLVLPSLLGYYTPDVVYEGLAAVFFPLLSWPVS